MKCDHRSKFSNLSNWKEEALLGTEQPGATLLGWPKSIYYHFYVKYI